MTVQPIKFQSKNFIGKYCLNPFISATIGIRGDVFLCGCFSWMPTSIGNLFQTTLQDLLDSALAQDIRQSVINGSYEYCNEKTCGIINNNQLGSIDTVPSNVTPLLENSKKFILPYEIVIAGDLTCNLSCPSCRTGVIKQSPDQIEKQQQLGKILSQNIFTTPTDQKINLMLSTSGELFASAMLLNFVSSIDFDKFPNVTLKVQTNGLLCEKNWHKLGTAQSKVKHLTITFDAARPKTYEILRRGGTWTELEAAMKFLSNLKRDTGMIFHTRMVVQQQNYQEILEFYNFSLKYGADQVEFVRLTDWATYGSNFAMQDVLDCNHPEFLQAQEMIKQVSTLPHTWLAGGFESVYNSNT
jgi:sulfatase maturation enzyme AslB (radical SAM superfamily)